MSSSKGILTAIAVVLLASTAAWAVPCEVLIGGEGAISTDEIFGDQGLLSGGEVATATFGYVITTNGAVTLTLTVTNTSPAVTGTENPVTPDAPVITDIFFSVPTQVTGMTFVSAGGTAAASSGWDFTFDPDGVPDSGFGFLQSVFDAGLEGGTGGGSPDPVIESINDPDATDGPGDPKLLSPVDFVFTLAFSGGVPAGFDANWFCDSSILGDPDWIAAAKFISGANGGSGTVTNIPEPVTIVSMLTGLAALAASRRMRRSMR